MNMSTICQKNARIWSCDFKWKAVFWETYRALGRVWRLILGWFCFKDGPAIDWRWVLPLNLPLRTISVSHFFGNFQVLLLMILQPLQSLNSCLLPCICIMQCIRSSFVDWIFVHYGYRIWFDPPFITFQFCQKSNLFEHGMVDTNLIHLMMMIQSWNCQKEIK